jgi:hypothetical protein
MKNTKTQNNPFEVGDWFAWPAWDKGYPVTEIVDSERIKLAFKSNYGHLSFDVYPAKGFYHATEEQIKQGKKDLGELINQIPVLKESKTFGHFDKVQCQLDDDTWGTEVGIVDGTYMSRDGKSCVAVKWPNEDNHRVHLASDLRHAVKPLVIANNLEVKKVDADTVKVGCAKIKKSEAKKVMELMGW